MDPITAPATVTPPPQTPVDETATSASVTADFELFLTLLTEQLRNQDPLNPVDSTEYVAQLASFSAVEQQVQANEYLAQLVEGGGTSPLADAANWIGKEVLAEGPVEFNGAPVDVMVNPPDAADAAVLTVRNDFGQVVSRQTVDPKADELTWDGIRSDGQVAALGRYHLTVDYQLSDVPVATAKAQSFALVEEVRLDGGSATLVTASGSEIALDSVSHVRSPS